MRKISIIAWRDYGKEPPDPDEVDMALVLTKDGTILKLSPWALRNFALPTSHYRSWAPLPRPSLLHDRDIIEAANACQALGEQLAEGMHAVGAPEDWLLIADKLRKALEVAK